MPKKLLKVRNIKTAPKACGSRKGKGCRSYFEAEVIDLVKPIAA